jgi:hypothetical protein
MALEVGREIRASTCPEGLGEKLEGKLNMDVSYINRG